MLEAEIERKEFDQRYTYVIDQKQKELETSSIEIRNLRIENEKHITFSGTIQLKTIRSPKIVAQFEDPDPDTWL